MPRERLMPPPTGGAARCSIDGCPLPPGCGQRCFIHDRLAGNLCDEATGAILKLDAFFRCAERMSNASPGDTIPTETRQALTQRCAGLVMPQAMTSRQCAVALRSWLTKQCRPEQGPPMPIAERMLAEGLTPIGDLIHE